MFLKRRCLKVEISKYLVKMAGTQYVLNIVCVCVCVCILSVYVYAKSLQSCPLFVTLWAIPTRLLCPWDSRQEYWSGLVCPPPGDLLNPGIKATSLMCPALAGRFFTTSTTWEPTPLAYMQLCLLSCARLFATRPQGL